ncbi:isoleucine--tRNA ligase [Brevibacterium sp. 50QC2O2]|uniref:isoleucine--tRNA ligase n=1 Tax=Brevibacterium TaxID=1696 RepID=UPI00211C512B|nr:MULTISPECIES: isoleucine--tRNA ligase [unclassified Brevibacterium]MCQ9384840.1 isoleucine--tRNA ligase [Brevibacterium sp. 68QC2CO]MCQ9387605.1 isoleucine--tRNA ligase [Brevibacterium sp. 50QC2O2]
MTETNYPKAGTSAFGLAASPDFPKLEEGILDYWKAEDTFKKSIAQRDAGDHGENEFVFYDGPPFANGLPHYGHLLTSYVKDVVPRYQTMRGKRVERRFGWDTHGLPAELEAMRQLGLKTKDEILEMGVEKFNAAARASVLRYTDEWQAYVNRMGRWVDFENDYKTLNPTFMESVLWVFKTLFDKGYIYEGYRVLPYCWSDETPLSNHELRMDDDVYKLRQDPAVTIGYKLSEPGPDGDDEYVLIWTTTPWTVPSNQAVAVNPAFDYVAVKPGEGAPEEFAGKTFILAEARLGHYARELGEEPTVLRHYTGTELLGKSYEPPFGYFEGQQERYGSAMHTILSADFVTLDDGTGIVHQSPAFGEEDKALTDTYGIEAARPVDDAGKFDSTVADYTGLQVFEANKPIIADLKHHTGPMAGRHAVLLRHETYEHSYPHCWRCRNPLIYRAVSSWFVRVTAFKDTMLKTNEDITWVPDNVKHGQFGKWLEGARDWSITRNRFWGSPVPVWKSDDPRYPRLDVYGSFADLERDFGTIPTGPDGQPNLHRPYIDDLVRPNPDDPTGQSMMRRVPDVLDVWFDSGSMPYGQVHYPFENKEWFEDHYPADFIVEYIGQTRGWFYMLHVLAAALFEKPAFKDVICHGIVLGSDGQKMSKSLRNYPDVNEVLDRDGSDAMRWFLMSSPILRGGNLIVTEQGIRDGVRQVILPLWNAWHFFATYANTADAVGGGKGYQAKERHESSQVLDRYLLAKTHDLIVDFQAQMDVYDVWAACQTLREYLDMLTNWYVRRSRRRFWDGTADTHETFDVFYTCLEAFLRVAAPLLPFVTEEIYRGLTGAESVHLTDYPDAQLFAPDEDLVAAMDATRSVCSVGSSLRKAQKLRVRLPLNSLTVASDLELGADFTTIIADELNLKNVTVMALEQAAEAGFSLETKLTVNARAAGPRLGKNVQHAIKGSKTGDWRIAADGTVTSGGIELVEGEYTLESVASAATEGTVMATTDSGFVALDTQLTPELEAEGVARDTVRAIQNVRKQLDLNVSDRIRVVLSGPAQIRAAVEAHAGLIREETLAVELTTSTEEPSGTGVFEAKDVASGVQIKVEKND